jgi:hypothetical protein
MDLAITPRTDQSFVHDVWVALDHKVAHVAVGHRLLTKLYVVTRPFPSASSYEEADEYSARVTSLDRGCGRRILCIRGTARHARAHRSLVHFHEMKL